MTGELDKRFNSKRIEGEATRICEHVTDSYCDMQEAATHLVERLQDILECDLMTDGKKAEDICKLIKSAARRIESVERYTRQSLAVLDGLVLADAALGDDGAA